MLIDHVFRACRCDPRSFLGVTFTALELCQGFWCLTAKRGLQAPWKGILDDSDEDLFSSVNHAGKTAPSRPRSLQEGSRGSDALFGFGEETGSRRASETEPKSKCGAKLNKWAMERSFRPFNQLSPCLFGAHSVVFLSHESIHLDLCSAV